jgi:hypothetical protein
MDGEPMPLPRLGKAREGQEAKGWLILRRGDPDEKSKLAIDVGLESQPELEIGRLENHRWAGNLIDQEVQRQI